MGQVHAEHAAQQRVLFGAVEQFGQRQARARTRLRDKAERERVERGGGARLRAHAGMADEQRRILVREHAVRHGEHGRRFAEHVHRAHRRGHGEHRAAPARRRRHEHGRGLGDTPGLEQRSEPCVVQCGACLCERVVDRYGAPRLWSRRRSCVVRHRPSIPSGPTSAGLPAYRGAHAHASTDCTGASKGPYDANANDVTYWPRGRQPPATSAQWTSFANNGCPHR